MKTDRKYRMDCSGSGWGVWSVSGEKIAACNSRVAALAKWYELEGWTAPKKWYRQLKRKRQNINELQTQFLRQVTI